MGGLLQTCVTKLKGYYCFYFSVHERNLYMQYVGTFYIFALVLTCTSVKLVYAVCRYVIYIHVGTYMYIRETCICSMSVLYIYSRWYLHVHQRNLYMQYVGTLYIFALVFTCTSVKLVYAVCRYFIYIRVGTYMYISETCICSMSVLYIYSR